MDPRINRSLCKACEMIVGITALADGLGTAIDRVYEAIETVAFEGMHYRKDIGRRAITEEK